MWMSSDEDAGQPIDNATEPTSVDSVGWDVEVSMVPLCVKMCTGTIHSILTILSTTTSPALPAVTTVLPDLHI